MVDDGIVTSAGVAAGIDMASGLVDQMSPPPGYYWSFGSQIQQQDEQNQQMLVNFSWCSRSFTS